MLYLRFLIYFCLVLIIITFPLNIVVYGVVYVLSGVDHGAVC